ncbi:MAG: bifunctional nuclease family protein [Candidatus Planktophila sp.]
MFTLVEVVGVRIEMPSNQPIVLLKEVEGTTFLPIWVGSVEATAIAFAQQDLRPARPLTHDLIVDILERTCSTLTAVHITEMRDGIFYAELQMRNVEGPLAPLSVRPSDAIAIALRTKTNILVNQDLLASAGIQIPAVAAGESEQEVEAFREFLDHINPEDFA